MNHAMVGSSDSKLFQTVGLLMAAALMALAANCFLSYLWWTACYNAWHGIPKLAEQAKAAGARATFNGWGLILLGAVSAVVLCGVIRMRESQLPRVLKIIVRLATSFVITIAGTGAWALVLSWIKQGIR